MRTLEVGVCGTDREISEGHFGVPPDGRRRARARPRVAGRGRARRSRLRPRRPRHRDRAAVVRALPRVRRGLRPTRASRATTASAGSPACTGSRASSWRRTPAQLIAVPRSLGRLGVLVEPASICARGIRHARAIGGRQPWELQRALVIGPARSGCSRRTSCRLDGLDVWTAGRVGGRREGRARRGPGARYVSTAAAPLASRARRKSAASTSSSRRPATPRSWPTARRCCAETASPACSGSTHAGGPSSSTARHRRRRGRREPRRLRQRQRAPDRLARGRRVARRDAASAGPTRCEEFVGLRVPLDRFAEAFDHRGVKATLVLDD